MDQHVLSQPPALSPSDAKLFVGALLSPQLSCVDNMKNMQSLDPIPENVLYSDKEPTNAEVIGQLQLTINGVTMGFDDFMDEYVSSYYPDVETKTYRVPPLHFNIQSFKRGTDYLEDMKDSRRSDPAEKEQSQNNSHFSESESEEEEITGPQEESREEFMPPGRSYCWQAGPVTGRLESAATFSDDESSDSDDVCCGYRRHLPIETVTLDSLPDEQQNFAADQDKDRTDAKTHFESGSTHARLAGTVTSVTSPPSGAPVLLLTPTLQLRNCGKDLPGPSTSPAYIETSPSGLNSGQAGYAAPEGGPGSNSAVGRSARSKVAAQAAVLDDTRVLSDVMAKDARADEGENRVINAMELLGQLLGQWFGPMFIICSYQYNNYLNKLREEMFCKGEASRPTRAFGQIMRAEHDCLIFHKDIGVLVVCIKAIGDNFSDWNASEDQIKASTAKILHKALKQLEREEAMIRHVTSDLRSRARLVCHSLVALPNMYRKQVDAALDTDPDLAKKIQNLTYGRGTKSFLCLDELPSKNMSVWDLPEESVFTRLVGWWKDLKSSLDAPENAIDIKVYKHIIGRYCGLLSTVEVWSPNNPRVEVRSRSEAVSLCAQRFSQVVLLPGQLQVLLSDHTRVYLYGPPGSGKTLLLMLKAREWLLRGEHVILINSRWGSSNGYPYAYGVLDRLKAMMTKDGVPHERLLMINIDTSRFHDYLLSNVLPSWCVLVDELTSATLPIIEHLCCLQVQNIWCAGLFEERRPHTAHRFQAFKMERVLRCPPILQSLLKHTEKAAKHSAPYWDAYEEPNTQGGVVPRSKWSPALYPQQKESDCPRDRNLGGYESSNETSSRSSNGSMKKEDKERENRRFDADSLNTRLAQLSIKYASPRAPARTHPEPGELSSLVSSRSVTGLPTDGPRPHVIDHEGHSQVGLPAHCSACGSELADFLKSMVRTEEPLESQGQGHQQEGGLKPRGDEATRGKFRRTSAGVTRKQNEVRASVNSPDHRLRVRFENRVLSWADVLIVTSSLDKDLPLLKYLARQGIPIELMPSSRQARYIETSRSRQRLFVTTYREVIGLERALIVFVPSGRSDDDFGLVGEKNQFSELKNLSLRHCLQRYSELDRCALWYMASRCLSDLVLLLP
ncbi:hypothetical protein EGW08_006471 [Elysia chlorotica]|uniref:Uncharacterized protein n=1 Tax=Elysia chlorotica TaxID=188477 RepID=A0A3S1BPL7_ELYCH|nr:hypothetical protein EGW08_006471 [Elysia chlorotica]